MTFLKNSPKILETDKIRLEPFSAKYLTDRYIAWLNDPVVCRDNRHGREEYTREKAQAYWERVQKDKSHQMFAVLMKPPLEHVGNISLSSISTDNASAQIAVLIGEKTAWGHGIGFEACRLLLDYGFSVLNLHRIWMGMTARNTAMIRIAEKLGMKQEGCFKDAFRKDGTYLDIVQFARLNSFQENGS